MRPKRPYDQFPLRMLHQQKPAHMKSIQKPYGQSRAKHLKGKEEQSLRRVSSTNENGS